MNIKFLDKVAGQILSETRINNDGKIHTPFSPTSLSSSIFFSLYDYFSYHLIPLSLSPLSKHCKEIYNLNKEETDYVWDKYKEGVTTLMGKKEPARQEKG